MMLVLALIDKLFLNVLAKSTRILHGQFSPLEIRAIQN
jgi:hypothetical protein